MRPFRRDTDDPRLTHCTRRDLVSDTGLLYPVSLTEYEVAQYDLSPGPSTPRIFTPGTYDLVGSRLQGLSLVAVPG